jgi:hypothetical protein
VDHPVTPQEAQAALQSIERERTRVVNEIDLPNWYWWGLALGWIGLGVLGDVGNPWVVSIATLAFGAAHAAVAPRILDGRHRTDRLSVSSEVAWRKAPALVFAALIAMVGVTIGLAFAAHADGARHPGTAASIVVAVIIVLGGPRLLGVVRRQSARSSWTS